LSASECQTPWTERKQETLNLKTVFPNNNFYVCVHYNIKRKERKKDTHHISNDIKACSYMCTNIKCHRTFSVTPTILTKCPLIFKNLWNYLHIIVFKLTILYQETKIINELNYYETANGSEQCQNLREETVFHTKCSTTYICYVRKFSGHS
jgi:hypothetical protein